MRFRTAPEWLILCVRHSVINTDLEHLEQILNQITCAYPVEKFPFLWQSAQKSTLVHTFVTGLYYQGLATITFDSTDDKSYWSNFTSTQTR